MPDTAAFGDESSGGFDDVAAQLAAYLDGDQRRFDVAMRADGDLGDHRVWALVFEIPYGETTTYGAIARRLGGAVTAQQVGSAVARNPLCILIPCHRVIGTNGKLTGYAGGLDRKRSLLDLESGVAPML